MILDNLSPMKKFKPTIRPELPLKMYIFLFRFNDFNNNSSDRAEVCFAYQLESAWKCMEGIYGNYPDKHYIKNVGEVEVSKIINAVETEKKIEKAEQKILFEIASTPPVENEMYNRMAYVCSLKYAADTFNKILTVNEKKSLNNIIKKIDKKLAYDAKYTRGEG